MASGDKLQIVLAAQDEISAKIKTVRGNIRTLAAEQKRYAELTEDGNEDAAKSYERVRQDILKQKAELVRLGAERSEQTREAKRLADEERRELKRLADEHDRVGDQAERSSRKQISGLRRLTRAFDRVAGSLGSTRRASERLDDSLSKLDDGADNFQRRWIAAITKVERKMTGFHVKTPGAGGAATSTAASGGSGMLAGGAAGGLLRTGVGAAVAGVGLLAGGALVKGAQVSRDREMMQLSMETLLGDAQKAAETMEWIKQTSAQTPFEMTGLALATQQLLGFGFGLDETKKNLITIGDAAAATGKGQEGVEALTRALGQMQAKQKVTGEEMMQLTEAGIPGWQLLADEMGTTSAELMNMTALPGGGKALFDKGGLDKLLEGMNKKYAGLMEKQADTFGGAQSNLMDTIGNGMSDSLENAGIMDFMTTLMQWLAEKLPLAFEAMRPVINDWVTMFKEAWPVIRPVLIGLGGVLMKVVLPALRIIFKVITVALKAIQWAADKVSKAWNGLGDFFRGVLDGINRVFTSWSEGIRNTINTVIGWINKIPGIEMELIGAPGVDGALWAGGAVDAGTYLVGELGPEMFVPQSGKPFMVGEQGMELRDLPGGVMIPNHLLGAVTPATANVTVNVPPQAPGGNTYNVTAADPREALREIERKEARERRLARERT